MSRCKQEVAAVSAVVVAASVVVVEGNESVEAENYSMKLEEVE